jgi:hypothetical protein
MPQGLGIGTRKERPEQVVLWEFLNIFATKHPWVALLNLYAVLLFAALHDCHASRFYYLIVKKARGGEARMMTALTCKQ